ncbi:MAG: hypothetical protein ABIJ20_03780 [Nanoarchaeota archaeon]|nr:hypothetical protein [Nanoarchaeota archaeon]MBU1445526.1 hypothetical protein [Nanoarchaeota archaeon]MBU2406594.1 hypothetical protein [Nanoarchaeota archaeon]MBU2420625.1 hypothetical protein [Nanoarchaeota archaeon]MBU2474927.1 hypothetical protein [Nanoarchaeota archaeon]
MTLDMIQQNSNSLVEVSQNFSRLERDKEILITQLEEAKQTKKRTQIVILSGKIKKLDREMDEMRVFILKVLTNLHRLVEEQQNGI